METRANYIMVGCFVLLLAFGLLGFVLWLAQFQFEEEYARYDIVFESSVTGLNEGSPVRYRGVRVGEVLSVDLDPDRPTAIRVTLEVQERTPVRADSVATLELEGRSEEHTSELQSLMRISYAVFCLKKTKTQIKTNATKL